MALTKRFVASVTLYALTTGIDASTVLLEAVNKQGLVHEINPIELNVHALAIEWNGGQLKNVDEGNQRLRYTSPVSYFECSAVEDVDHAWAR
jgi:hypothetical protein